MTTEDRIRVTHREREDAVEELRAAYAVGCLDDDELEGRVSRAYAAKIRGELTALVCDLPTASEPGDAVYGPATRPAVIDWSGQVRRALGLACWLMLAAVGAWVIGVVVVGVVAVPLICLWLTTLQLRTSLLRWGRQAAAAVLISRFSAITNGPVPGKEV